MVNAGRENPSRLLTGLYRGAADPEQWPAFLTELAAYFHSDSAALRITGLRPRRFSVLDRWYR